MNHDKVLTFTEILIYYSQLSLDKPADIRTCAYEMLRMKPNEKSCRDKYSAWYSKEESQMFETEMEGKFGGIGLEVSEQDGKVVIVSPIDGTPAYRAGLKSDDVITKVDGIAVVNIMDAVKRMRGKPGTAVDITVDRKGKETTIQVIREIITIHAVSAKTIDGPSGAIDYIKVKTFSEILPEEFRKKMSAIRAKGIMKVVLDFRNNPGGLLWQALEVLYDFARPGDTLMVMRERDQSTIFDTAYVKKKLELKHEPGMFRDMRVVILVNKGSASASEIFAGTMKDWSFPVVGTNTFGKGVGQTTIPLSNGSLLRLTTFEFLVGNSKTKINDIGVIPTHEVVDPKPSSSETLREDKQLEKAIELLSR
ncbi:MAG: S41 family peptidase [Parcubacteria group bacterium]|nr:S41 family peptidase [Parcubacteria group bacterium]